MQERIRVSVFPSGGGGKAVAGEIRLVDPCGIKVKWDKGQFVDYDVRKFGLLMIEERNYISLSGDGCMLKFICINKGDRMKFLEFLALKMKMVRVDASRYRLEVASDAARTGCAGNVLERGRIREFLEANVEEAGEVGAHVTLENYRSAVLYNADIDRDAIFPVFKMLLPAEGRVVSYGDMKKQWELMTKGQFANHMQLRRLVLFLEKCVNDCQSKFACYQNPARVQKRVFDIALAYSLYNWDAAAFCAELVSLLLPFVDAYIGHYGEDDENCESEVFPVFVEFWDRYSFNKLNTPNKQDYVKPVLKKAWQMMENIMSELIDLLRSRHVHNPDFLISDCSTWYCHDFTVRDTQILWISALSFGNWQNFFSLLAFALVRHLASGIDELSALSYEEFLDRFARLKTQANLRVLLTNAQRLSFALEG